MVRLLHCQDSSVAVFGEVSIPQWCDCCEATETVAEDGDLFQSHNGAIAAEFVYDVAERTVEFQSHNGAIAAQLPTPAQQTRLLFQSHNGAIAAICVKRTLSMA